MSDVKVLCAAPCGKQPVYDAFYDSFATLEAPKGSIKQRIMGGSVPGNLNKIVDSAIAHKCSHLFIVEDDSSFASDTLMRLLAHDKPVVAGLCRSRQSPFLPYIYSQVDEEHGLEWYDLKPEETGLIKVGATGMGGILINMDVFKKLKRPYFQYYYIGEQQWGQDIIFGKDLIEAGIDVYCDLDVVIHHATQCVIGSENYNGGWYTVIKINEAIIKIPYNSAEVFKK